MEAQTSIAKHYGDGTDLERRVEEELGASVSLVEKNCLLGMRPDSISFMGGTEATEDLAQLLAPLPAIHVLDVENVGQPLRDETADPDFWH